MADQKTGVFIRFRAPPGGGDALAAHLVKAAGEAELEPGTLLWIVHRTPDTADTIWVYEAYASDAARAAHEASAAYQAAREHTRSLLGGPPEVFPVLPIAGKGL